MLLWDSVAIMLLCRSKGVLCGLLVTDVKYTVSSLEETHTNFSL